MHDWGSVMGENQLTFIRTLEERLLSLTCPFEVLAWSYAAMSCFFNILRHFNNNATLTIFYNNCPAPTWEHWLQFIDTNDDQNIDCNLLIQMMIKTNAYKDAKE